MQSPERQGGTGYLRGVLVAGARPFPYRARVGALLGATQAHAEVKSASRIPPVAFHYPTTPDPFGALAGPIGPPPARDAQPLDPPTPAIPGQNPAADRPTPGPRVVKADPADRPVVPMLSEPATHNAPLAPALQTPASLPDRRGAGPGPDPAVPAGAHGPRPMAKTGTLIEVPAAKAAAPAAPPPAGPAMTASGASSLANVPGRPSARDATGSRDAASVPPARRSDGTSGSTPGPRPEIRPVAPTPDRPRAAPNKGEVRPELIDLPRPSAPVLLAPQSMPATRHRQVATAPITALDAAPTERPADPDRPSRRTAPARPLPRPGAQAAQAHATMARLQAAVAETRSQAAAPAARPAADPEPGAAATHPSSGADRSGLTRPPQTVLQPVYVNRPAPQTATPRAFWERSYLGSLRLRSFR